MPRMVPALTLCYFFLLAACSPPAGLSTSTPLISPNSTAIHPTATISPTPTAAQTPMSTPWSLSGSLSGLPPSYIFLDTQDGILSFAINAGGLVTSFPASSTNLSPSSSDRGYIDLSPDGDLIAIAQVGSYPGLGLQSSIRVLSRRDSRTWQVAPKGSNFPAWSPDGESIAYVDYLNNRICLANREGPFRCLQQGAFSNSGPPSWSPDGARLAYCASITPPQCDVYVTALEGGASFLVASDGYDPEWSPDGTWITFSACSPNGCLLHLARPAACEQGTAGCLTAISSVGNVSQATWSPDGTRLAVRSTTQDGVSGIGILDSACLLAQATCPQRTLHITDPALAIGDFVWSPDGKAIAFTAQRGSSSAFYIALADGSSIAMVANIASDYISMLQWGPE